MLRNILSVLKDIFNYNGNRVIVICVFIMTLFIRFEAIDCLKQQCSMGTHGSVIDFINLGQTTLAYSLILILFLLFAMRDDTIPELINAVFRMFSGGILGYFFPLLVMLGTQLFDVKFIYPYIILSSLFGMIIFLSTQINLAVKIMVIIGFNFLLIPGATIVNSDVYRYAFEGKTDLAHSNGYYALLYSQIWMYLTRLVLLIVAYIIIDTETLGYTYTRIKEIQQAFTSHNSSSYFQSEFIVQQDRKPYVLSNITTSVKHPEKTNTTVDVIRILTTETASEAESDASEEYVIPNSPLLPHPVKFLSREQLTIDHVIFGGYAFHPLQFRVLQLLPQNIPAKKLELDYYFLYLKSRHYPNRNITSPVILMDVYTGMRQHQAHILSVSEGENLIPARTRTARKLLIAWLIKMGISYTENYNFLDSEKM